MKEKKKKNLAISNILNQEDENKKCIQIACGLGKTMIAGHVIKNVIIME
jgi:hypothetical protein